MVKNKCYLLLLLISLYSCSSEVNINGHWHLKSVNLNNNDANKMILDFEDSLAYINKYVIGSSGKGELNYSIKEIDFKGACGSGLMKYELYGNKLRIKGSEFNFEYVGTKCEFNCCTFYEHAFDNTLVNISLPKSNLKIKNLELSYDNYLNLFIGYPKREEFKSETACNINDSFVVPSEFPIWLNTCGESSSECNVIIFSSKETAPEFLDSVITTIKNTGKRNVYQAFEKNTFENGESPYFMKLVE